MWEAYGIDPRNILVRQGFNVRDFNSPQVKAHIAWLKTSIKERGVDEPIFVENTGDKLYLIDGECRLRACCELWNEGTKVHLPTISYKGDEGKILAKSLASNNGLPLTILELGKGVDRLMALGWKESEIATLMGPHLGFKFKQAKRHIRTAVELHNAPMAVKKAVTDGIDGVKVSPAAAVAAVKANRETAADKLASQAKKAKQKGKTEIKREKMAGPATRKRIDEGAALIAAEKLATAIDVWIEDATDPAEKALIAAHKEYRKIVPAKLV